MILGQENNDVSLLLSNRLTPPPHPGFHHLQMPATGQVIEVGPGSWNWGIVGIEELESSAFPLDLFYSSPLAQPTS